MRTTRLHFALLLLLAAIVAVGLGSCAPTRPTPDERATASIVAPPVQVDTAGHLTPLSLPAGEGAKPGILAGIGRVFSTPEGRVNRHAVRLARAAGPRKLGKGAVYAPKAEKVVSGGYKSQGPTTNADSGATVNVTDIDKNKAPAATAPHATATSTERRISPWWLLLLLIPVGWLARKFFIPFA